MKWYDWLFYAVVLIAVIWIVKAICEFIKDNIIDPIRDRAERKRNPGASGSPASSGAGYSISGGSRFRFADNVLTGSDASLCGTREAIAKNGTVYFEYSQGRPIIIGYYDTSPDSAGNISVYDKDRNGVIGIISPQGQVYLSLDATYRRFQKQQEPLLNQYPNIRVRKPFEYTRLIAKFSHLAAFDVSPEENHIGSGSGNQAECAAAFVCLVDEVLIDSPYRDLIKTYCEDHLEAVPR